MSLRTETDRRVALHLHKMSAKLQSLDPDDVRSVLHDLVYLGASIDKQAAVAELSAPVSLGIMTVEDFMPEACCPPVQAIIRLVSKDHAGRREQGSQLIAVLSTGMQVPMSAATLSNFEKVYQVAISEGVYGIARPSSAQIWRTYIEELSAVAIETEVAMSGDSMIVQTLAAILTAGDLVDLSEDSWRAGIPCRFGAWNSSMPNRNFVVVNPVVLMHTMKRVAGVGHRDLNRMMRALGFRSDRVVIGNSRPAAWRIRADEWVSLSESLSVDAKTLTSDNSCG